MHLSGDATGERNLIGGQQRDELAADLRHLVAREVVDDHQAMQAEHLAVDLVHRLACFIEDVVVLAEAKDLLANLVSHCSSPGAPSHLPGTRSLSEQPVGERAPQPTSPAPRALVRWRAPPAPHVAAWPACPPGPRRRRHIPIAACRQDSLACARVAPARAPGSAHHSRGASPSTRATGPRRRTGRRPWCGVASGVRTRCRTRLYTQPE